MRLAVELGELRGRFMAGERRRAFREKHGREASFVSRFNKDGYAEDFVEATALIDIEALFAEFLRQAAALPMMVEAGRRYDRLSVPAQSTDEARSSPQSSAVEEEKR